MLGIILLLVAFIGSSLASICDLKTTEIPDEIPYVMMGIGIIGNLIESYLTWSYWPFLLSVIVGLSFFGIGFLMYFMGQWGGGDAKLLSAMGFLIPQLPTQFQISLFFPFPISFFFNVFFVGAIYMILYSLIMTIMNKKIWTVFLSDLRANSRSILILNSALVAALILSTIILTRYYQLLVIDIMTFGVMMILVLSGLFILWKFVKTVENVGFKKKIPISELKVGDVPLDYKVWEGITEEKLKEIKKSNKKYIWIKEGVRFAPAFPIALLFTLLLGDGILLLIEYTTLL